MFYGVAWPFCPAEVQGLRRSLVWPWHRPWRQPGPNGGIQMIITRASEGLWSSSRAYPIQVDRPGTRETVPDRFRLIPDDFSRKILTLTYNNDVFEKKNTKSCYFQQKVNIFIRKSSGISRNRSGTVSRAPGRSTCIGHARDELHSPSDGGVMII